MAIKKKKKNYNDILYELQKEAVRNNTGASNEDLVKVATQEAGNQLRNAYKPSATTTTKNRTNYTRTGTVPTTTTKTTTKTKKKVGLFDAFDDGYDFGDVTKTILTGGKMIWDSATVIGKGIIEDPIQTVKSIGVGIGEGFTKADEMTNNAVDDFFNWIVPGREEKRKNDLSVDFLNLEKFSKTATDEEKAKVLQEYEDKLGKDDPLYQSAEKILAGENKKGALSKKYYDTDTYVKAEKGELSETQQEIYEQGQSAGGMGYDLLWSYMTFGMGKGLGATAKTAKVASEIAGKTSLFVRSQQSTYEEAIAEGYTEKEARLLGVTVGGIEVGLESIGFDELKGLDTIAKGNLVKKAFGEATEEFLAPYGEEIARRLYLGEKADWEETTEEALKGAGAGAVLGVVMGSGGKGYSKEDTVINKINNGETVTDAEMADALKELEASEPGVIKDAMQKATAVMKNELQVQETTEEDIAPTKEIQQEEVLKEQPIQEEVDEETQSKRRYYQYEESETDSEVAKVLKESATRTMNDSKRSHEFVDTVAKFAEKTGTKYRFTNDTELRQLGHVVEKAELTEQEQKQLTELKQQLTEAKTQQEYDEIQNKIDNITYYKTNGLVTDDGEVLINIDSQKALNSIVGHETFHLVENEAEADKLRKFAKKYAETRGDYQERLDRANRLYANTKANIDNEVTADIIGDYLFTDQQFINNLSTEQPNLFQRIYNEIKHWIKMATAGSKEARQLEQLQHSFEKALNSKQTSETTDSNGRRFMVTGEKGHKQLDKQQGTTDYIDNYNEALSMDKNKETAKDIREQTGWYKDANNDWKFEISDKEAKLKEANLRANGKYTVTEILDHKVLEEMYPHLNKTKVVFEDLETARGRTNKLTGTIYINNNLINDKTQLRKTLLHELQHNIQRKEGFQQGTTTAEQNDNYERYKNNFGETEAREASDRADLSFEERQNNPAYTSTYQEGQKGKKLYTKKDNKWYNLLGGNYEEVNTEDTKTHQTNTRDDVVGVNEELDNSSFFNEKNKGYHYGNLGKARDTNYFSMSNTRRSTGHFGNGTYFVGNKDSNVGSLKDGRPVHEVEFSDYNLFKPKNSMEAERLHSLLKDINNEELNAFKLEDAEKLFNKSYEELYEAYKNTTAKAEEYKKLDDFTQLETDSLSTVFMKELGYNGIDVRGIEGFDNGTYGSVIYDLDNKTSNPDIRYSLSEETISEKTQRAIDTMGTTTNMKVAGYLTVDGQFIDFSGKYQGARGDQRQMDHREIADIYTDEEYDIAENKYSNMGSATAIMQDFIDEGNIRTTGTGVDISREPTKTQYDKLYDYLEYVQRDNGEVYIDLESETKNRENLEYGSKISVSKMIKDIKEHYSKYSLSNQNEDVAPIGNYNVYGKDVKADNIAEEEIAPAQQNVAENTSSESLRNLNEEYIDDTEGTFIFNDGVLPKIKGKQNIINKIRSDFNIKTTEARDLYNKIANAEYETVDDVLLELEAYRDVKFKETNDYYADIKKDIRGARLDVSNIKDQITDYGRSYRTALMGKGIILGNQGQAIDDFYQELSEAYPNVFPADITAEADQLEAIADFMYKDTTYTITDTIPDEALYDLAQELYAEIGNNERYRGNLAHDYFQKQAIKNGELIAPVETQEDYLKTLPGKLDDSYAPYLDMAKKLNGENTIENSDIADELNRLSTNTQETTNQAEKGEKEGSKVTKKKGTALDTLKYLVTNRNVAIDNYAKEVGNNNIKYLADHVNNVYGEVSTNINNVQTDNYGKAIGKSITDIFNQARKEGLSEAFNDYLFHRSNVARHGQGKGSKITLLESDLLIKEYNKDYPQFKKWANEVNQYNRNNLYKQVEAGLYTQEFADNLVEKYSFYVPFFEDIEKNYVENKSREIGARGTVKRAKGGADRNLLDFEQAMMKQTQSAITSIRKNQLYKEIVKSSKEKITIGIGNRDASQLFADEKGYYLVASDGGVQTATKISEDLYKGLQNNLEQQIKDIEAKLGGVTKTLQTLGNIRRNMLTTWSPTFIVTNPLKDLQDAPLNSKYATSWAKNYPKAMKELTTGKGEHVQEFLNMYGQANLMGDYTTDSGVFDVTKSAKIGKKLSKISQANEILEMIPRYAEYLASLEHGTSQMEALYNAREVTTNFGRGGVITKALNRNGFTFLNASVQGFDKLIRNFSGENGAKGVVNATLKATMLGIAPALLNALMYDDDEEYVALPDYIKDNYYLIKTDEGEFVRIPKGRMLSIFGSAGRRTLEFMQGEEDAFEGFLQNAYSQVGVQNPLESNILAPLLQAYGSENGETWYGTDIVPSRLQDVPEAEQYDETTDKLSIWLGDKLKASPYKINYVLDQYTGGMGDIALPLITEEGTSDAETLPEMLLAPIKDKFTANSTTDNKYVSDVYTLSDELYKKSNSAYATDEDKLVNQYIYSITSDMGELYAERRAVQNDSSLTKAEKYAKSQAIKDEINRLAKEGLDGYKNVNKTENYAIVGGREFNKYTANDGTERWGSVYEDVLEEMNSLGMELEEKSEFFNAQSAIKGTQNSYDGSTDYNAKKRDIISIIKDTNLNDEQKAYLYDKYYASTETLNAVTTLGIDFDAYLDFECQEFEADVDRNGKTISGSKKKKVFDYINSMDIDFEQKLVLAKLQYNSYDEYNHELINYLNQSDLTFEEEVELLKKMGFEVDSQGNISW